MNRKLSNHELNQDGNGDDEILSTEMCMSFNGTQILF